MIMRDNIRKEKKKNDVNVMIKGEERKRRNERICDKKELGIT